MFRLRNDYPAEFRVHHGEDDSDFDRLTVSSGDLVGYRRLMAARYLITCNPEKGCRDTEYHYLSYFDETVMAEQVFAIQRIDGSNK